MRACLVIACALTGLVAETATAQLYRRPVECDDCIEGWYYVDHGFTQDWNCSSSTYSGHLGTDYSLRGGNAAIEIALTGPSPGARAALRVGHRTTPSPPDSTPGHRDA